MFDPLLNWWDNRQNDRRTIAMLRFLLRPGEGWTVERSRINGFRQEHRFTHRSRGVVVWLTMDDYGIPNTVLQLQLGGVQQVIPGGRVERAVLKAVLRLRSYLDREATLRKADEFDTAVAEHVLKFAPQLRKEELVENFSAANWR